VGVVVFTYYQLMVEHTQGCDLYEGGAMMSSDRIRWCTLLTVLALVCISLTVAVHFLISTEKPPRPMFHNFYGLHPDRGMETQWFQASPYLDNQGNVLWVDVEDNLLVLILRQQDARSGILPALRGELTNATVQASLNGKDRLITIPRTQNKVYIISQDLTPKIVPVVPGAADHMNRIASSSNGYVAAIQPFVPPAHRSEFDEFVLIFERRKEPEAGDR
jgi:hypothetical protein